MPIVDAGECSVGGFACTCKAFRLGEPTRADAVRAVARSFKVTVQKTGLNQWLAWTTFESKYVVVYDPNQPGGWCKHIAACSLPWMRQVADGILTLDKRIVELEGELKAWKKTK